jgi:hypothetical protein
MVALSPPRIVCAANKHPHSQEIAIGIRHFCPLMRLNISMMCSNRQVDSMTGEDEYSLGWINSEQGFVDQHGVFYTRKAAWKIADANGQIFRDKDKCAGDLYSEHLY